MTLQGRTQAFNIGAHGFSRHTNLESTMPTAMKLSHHVIERGFSIILKMATYQAMRSRPDGVRLL
jgi:hypothetical protein